MISEHQPTIFDPKQVKALVSSRQDGNTKPEWSSAAETAQVLEMLAKELGVAADSLVVMLIDGATEQWDEIYDLQSEDAGKGVYDPQTRIAADAFVTNIPNIVLVLPTADCLPVILHDPKQHVIALVHLGRPSTVADLAFKTVQHMIQKYGTKPQDIQVFMGPAISKTSYILENFSEAAQPIWQPFVHRLPAGYAVDLSGFNKKRLLDAGVQPKSIQISSVDTATTDEYFSHYRAVRTGEAEGRFATLCMLLG